MGFRTKTILWKLKWEVVMLKTKTKQSSHRYQKQFNTLSGGIKQIFCCQGEKRTRSQKENRRKAKKKRKQERLQAAVFKTMKNITLDLWTIENLCFPEGDNISSTSQHSLCEEELNVDNLARLKRSAVEHLHIMRNQGLFAMDKFELVDNTIKRVLDSWKSLLFRWSQKGAQ